MKKLILVPIIVGLFWILFASYKNKYEDKAVLHYELQGEGRHVIGIHNPERIDSIVVILDVVCKQVFKTSVNQINN